MTAFRAMLRLNIKRRCLDGFAVGYNLIFPVILIGLLGVLCKRMPFGGVTSYQYYTIVTIPFCMIMAVITAAYAGKDDAYAKTAQRVLVTPISIRAIVWAKIISCGIVIFLCSILVYIGAAFATGMNLKKLGMIGILFLALAFTVASVGTWIGLGMKNFLVLKNIMNIPIAVSAILGGTFFRIGTFHKVGNAILNLSPIRWINRSMFLFLYEEQRGLLWSVIIVLLLLVPLLVTMAAVLGNALTEKTLRVGVCNPTLELEEQLQNQTNVQYEIVEPTAVKTEYIMGTYHYVLDGKAENRAVLREIKKQTKAGKEASGLSDSERFIALLFTVYLVIATVYASKYIQDREGGMLQRAWAAGMKRGQYLMGYFLSTELILFIQITIAMLCFGLLEQGDFLVTGKAVAAVGIISISATLSGVLYANFCKREMTANLMASSLAVIFSILGGTFVAVEQMPDLLQKISMFSPVRWILVLLF